MVEWKEINNRMDKEWIKMARWKVIMCNYGSFVVSSWDLRNKAECMRIKVFFRKKRK